MADNLKYFKDPPSKFRGAPFWSWNCKLDKELILRQIEHFRKMGMGGYTMHARTGLDTEYMGEEFIECIKLCAEKAKELNMEAHLYDEDKWPSGYGGGEVTKDKKYRYRYIVFTPDPPDGEKREPWVALIAHNGPENGERTLLAKYDVTIKDGYLDSYRLLKENETGDNVWYAYSVIPGDHPGFNGQAYVDVLNPEAIERFIETTHERFKEALGEDFGTVCPDIFTDEPETVLRNTFNEPYQQGPVSIPYTDAFDKKYTEKYGVSFFEHLPEVFWELPENKASIHRFRYHDFTSDLFAEGFSKTLGDWCGENGIKLTGHLQDEDRLANQTRSVGECMRHYPHYQLPGIDVLCNSREYSTAKQAQSVAHQTGAEGLTSELYGVTNWDFDFRGHKLQGDWQAALGVIHRVHHLAYMSMAGESKRDYPASIFYQSPWYDHYGYMEDYFARVITALTTGEPSVRVGVIHPIESFWLSYGVNTQTGLTREICDRHFGEVTHWLLENQVDFDYISEALLTTLDHKDGEGFTVGRMSYEAVIVPDCRTLRSTTVKKLNEFVSRGGKVIFMGQIPSLVDVAPSDEVARLAEKCTCIPFDARELMKAVAPFRDVEIKGGFGQRSGRYMYALREHNGDKILFVAQAHGTPNPDIPRFEDVVLEIRGTYSVKVMNGFTGDIADTDCVCENGKTYVKARIYDQDSLLLYLTKEEESFKGNSGHGDIRADWFELCPVNNVTGYELEEPNVLLLDQAKFRLSDGEWEGKEETLRIDNLCRRRVGYPTKPGSELQPWLLKEVADDGHTLALRFEFFSEIDVKDALFACEVQKNMKISINGEAVDMTPVGYFTDEFIKTFALPEIREGENVIEVTMDFTRRVNVEWCYLLGDFGVQLKGNSAYITKRPECIGFSDLVNQRMPFYGGNVKLYTEIEINEDGEYGLKMPKFRAPLITVTVDGGEEIPVALSPYTADLGFLKKGTHKLCVRVFGNRFNSFGPLHMADEGRGWIDPHVWRTNGDDYCCEYLVRRNGILTSPKLMKKR